jgi:polar amino acid transport system substrate-binding protein
MKPGRFVRSWAVALGFAGFLSLACGNASAQHTGTLKAGLDFGVVPFGMINASGEKVGFSIELTKLLAQRLGRPGFEVVDQEFSGMFPALAAGRFEFIVTPMFVTKERAEQMLYSEPYFPADSGFIIKQGATMNGLEDLRGKVLAINNGTQYDRWAQANAEKYGFEIHRYSNVAETIQAVTTGRAFATVNQSPTMIYAASQNRRVKIGYIDRTGDNFGLAFRKDDVAFRNRVEEVLECMKLDGTLRELYVKWFTEEPDPNSSIAKIYDGYGVPGMPGYDPALHTPQCK